MRVHTPKNAYTGSERHENRKKVATCVFISLSERCGHQYILDILTIIGILETVETLRGSAGELYYLFVLSYIGGSCLRRGRRAGSVIYAHTFVSASRSLPSQVLPGRQETAQLHSEGNPELQVEWLLSCVK